ncbi:NAD-dependent epimerase/dehydratase family protein [Candidatus Woesearchaeota archaeon]|nr:NAD-dependent epimerase/dehydratase family protein [Candidatus Woesearchaeota archaeon]
MRDMTKLFADENSTIKEVMRVIDLGSVKTALIVDKNNKLQGIATDGDIRRGILNGVSVSERISKVMNKDPIHAKVGASRAELIRLMKEKDILGLPLLDENGTVTDFIMLSGTGISNFNLKSKLDKAHSRILVIGGAGFIGSVLVRKLLAKGYKVNVLDIFLYEQDSLKEIADNPNLKIIKGDSRHIEDVAHAARDVDAVVHLAELVGDPACALNTMTTQEVNYLATKTVAEVCKYFQLNRLVYASSCSVYGASEGDELLTETSRLNPVSLYAKMKIASENALLEMKDENFCPTILRLSTVFGFSHRPRFDLVVNLLTAKAMIDKKITVFGGDQWRPNVHVADVADTIIAVLEAPIELVGGQIFNVGSEVNNTTIRQLGEMIKKEIPDAELIIDKDNTDRRDYKVDFSKLRNQVNFCGNLKLLDGVVELKKAFEQNLIADYKQRKYNNYLFLTKENEKK